MPVDPSSVDPAMRDVPAEVAATTATEGGAVLDAAEIGRIVAFAEAIPRNLQITLGYCLLSRVLAGHLGTADANWCTFATWASKRAGQTIRGDDLPALRELRERVRRRLEEDPAFHAALGRVAARLRDAGIAVGLVPGQIASHVDALVQAASAQVAEGNLKVFAELAPAFAAFAILLETSPGSTGAAVAAAALSAPEPGDDRAAQLARFLAGFRAGAPDAADTDGSGQAGQDLLRAAFSHYAEAAAELDPATRAELILLANLLVGLHEQTRLQPNIAGALDAPLRLLRQRITDDVAALLPLWKRPAIWVAGQWLLEPVLAQIARIWREEATRYLMTLPLPGEVLGLGWDIPERLGQPMFPDALRRLRNPDLIALLQRYDRTWDTTVGSAAVDWADLGDRMHYIADLFRARQQEAALLDPPFTAEQSLAIREGRVPDGPL